MCVCVEDLRFLKWLGHAVARWLIRELHVRVEGSGCHCHSFISDLLLVVVSLLQLAILRLAYEH